MLISGTTGGIIAMENKQLLPGIVLSKMKATEPPTNMAVVSRTFNTWSISAMPEKDKERQTAASASNQDDGASTF